MVVDFGRTTGDYADHRAGFPPAFFARLRPYGIGLKGQKVLDLGTGTGTLARGLAQQGCRVVGLDPAPEMLAQARALDRRAGADVNYVVGRAEQTGFPDGAFEAVTAGQCWHWFDRPRAARECFRLLGPGGRLVIGHFDWIPLPGNVVEATEALILRHNPTWNPGRGTGLYPAWLTDVASVGFRGLEVFAFDVDQLYSHEAWRGRVRASSGVAASLPPEKVARFDAEHARLLAERFPDDPLHAHHRVFAVIAERP